MLQAPVPRGSCSLAPQPPSATKYRHTRTVSLHLQMSSDARDYVRLFRRSRFSSTFLRPKAPIESTHPRSAVSPKGVYAVASLMSSLWLTAYARNAIPLLNTSLTSLKINIRHKTHDTLLHAGIHHEASILSLFPGIRFVLIRNLPPPGCGIPPPQTSAFLLR